ncbi:metallophosphoesterase family protein [Thalassorhabdomicrobium marinisediminis]|uniref:metallophosphoesterase family protein n=1 Tax=Thalassorhabdomicrobium marinisediminis TaxID=2170577 RepID=UPI003CD0C57D
MTSRVAILSDLHCDSYARAGRDPIGAHGLGSIIDGSLDAVIIAGDLTNGPPRRRGRALALLTRYVAPGKIYPLPGNHDYYHGGLTDDPLLEAQARSAGAHFIQKPQLNSRNVSVGYPDEVGHQEAGDLFDACLWES